MARPRAELRGTYHTGLMDALRGTLASGAVVAIGPFQAHGYYRWKLKQEGLRLRTRKTGGEILAWCERRD